MKFNKWTLGLAAVGVVSLASAVQAEEKSNPVMTALSSTSISGYVDTSAIWKFGNSTSETGAGGALPGRAYDGAAKQDGFNLNVVKLTLEKPLDEAEWSAGYKVDMLFGPDAVAYNTSANTIAGLSDFSIKQAYVALRAPVGNGIEFKMGTWDTCIGYEVFESGNNPNYSRSYGYTIEPTAHTGLLAAYKVNDVVGLQAGIANTAAAGINARPVRAGDPTVSESEKTYMGMITLTAPESLGFLAGSVLTAGIVDGLNGGSSDTTWIYVGGTAKTPVEGLTVGASYDQVLSKDKGQIGTGNYTAAAYAYAIAGYVGYQATEKLKLNGRVDYGRGSNGTWYFVGANETDAKNALLGLTGTVDYKLWENVISRVEFRWDKDLTTQHLASGTPGPFGFDDRTAMSLALNLIYQF